MRDLEERCFKFSIAVRDFCFELPRHAINDVYIKQVVRSSSSIGANCIEANENLGKADMLMHLRIARKEAKETQYWLQHFISNKNELDMLKQEVGELRKILSAIIKKLENQDTK